MADPTPGNDLGESSSILERALSVGAIWLLFGLLASAPPPDVNEAHYLAMARHHWDPSFCPQDFFLSSGEAHGAFYFFFGGVTTLCSFSSAAWIGRLLVWGLLAWSWERLSQAVLPGRWIPLLSAALFACLLQRGHMAGEWVLGGVEAKGFAYAFVFLGLEAVVIGRWQRAWPLWGLAASCHVLVGGWAVVAGLLAWAMSGHDRPRALAMLPWLLLGFLFSLPGLLPALTLNSGVDAETTQLANQIYVFQRLSHHLVFHEFAPQLIARHCGLLLVTASLAWIIGWNVRQRRLLRVMAGAVAISVTGLVIDLATLSSPDLAAGLLKYYWFRLADVMVPVAGSFLLLGLFHQRLADHYRVASIGLTLLTAVSAASSFLSVQAVMRDPRPLGITQAAPSSESHRLKRIRFRDWQLACGWISENLPSDALVLTPRHQQTFKWYAQRSEFVNWKDVPQNASAIVEWKERMLAAYPPESVWQGLAGLGEARLIELAERYGFQFILIDRSRSRRRPEFERVFPPEGESRMYELYRVPWASTANEQVRLP